MRRVGAASLAPRRASASAAAAAVSPGARLHAVERRALVQRLDLVVEPLVIPLQPPH